MAPVAPRVDATALSLTHRQYEELMAYVDSLSAVTASVQPAVLMAAGAAVSEAVSALAEIVEAMPAAHNSVAGTLLTRGDRAEIVEAVPAARAPVVTPLRSRIEALAARRSSRLAKRSPGGEP